MKTKKVKSDGSTRRSRRIYFYDGANPRETELSCMNNACRKTHNKKDQVGNLLVCKEGCGTFHFCCKACAAQQNHDCLNIQKLRTDIEVLFQNADLMMLLCDPVQVGNINKRRHPVAFTYICARFKLANALSRVAQDHLTRRHWVEATSILQDNLRLCHLHLHTSPKSWCHQFATCLMHSGRLKDTLSFLAYVMTRNTASSTVEDRNLHIGRVDGAWIYPSLSTNVCTSKEYRCAELYLVFVMYLTRLKQMLALTLVRQSMQLFRKTDCYRMIEGLEADGPLCILLEYLLPWKFYTLVTWESFAEYCDHLHLDLLSMASIIQERNPHLLLSIEMLKRNRKSDRNTEWAFSSPPASKQYAAACIQKCSYSILTMPSKDLDIWLKYCKYKCSY